MDFNVRSDSVNVEQIMEQIRARIRDKRGVDYTEEQIRELAAVKLQKFLDPRGVRSDLLEQFRKTQPPYQAPELPNYAFEDNTLFDSHRGPLRFIRRLLKPILKLFFNPNPLIQALNIQSRVNTMLAEREARLEASRRSTESLYYELIHNLVVETTRLGIEVKNLTMRIESLTSRLEFSERRARSLESAVVYRTEGRSTGSIGSTGSTGSTGSAGSTGSTASAGAAGSAGSAGSFGSMGSARSSGSPIGQVAQGSFGSRPEGGAPAPGATGGQPGGPEGPGQRSRRRRRRRGRRGGPPAASIMAPGAVVPASTDTGASASTTPTPSEAEGAPAAQSHEAANVTHSPAAESLEQAPVPESRPSEPAAPPDAARSDIDPEG